ncbi:MAG: molybdenum cofactor biosynthesis protein B [Gammaproteobacteria bacterium]|nr:MAG: molybdenum cofactor biosynthesis protein B [Gammaproteobacteria bacterium]
MGHTHSKQKFIALKIGVLTVSDTRTADTDKSGQYLVDSLIKEGHILSHKKIVPDDIYQIRATVSNWAVDKNTQIIIITGGTGITHRDITPEAVKILLDKEIYGFGEYFRTISIPIIGNSAIQSRALAGIINHRLLFALPGSTGAVKDAWEGILKEQLDKSTKPCNLVEMME